MPPSNPGIGVRPYVAGPSPAASVRVPGTAGGVVGLAVPAPRLLALRRAVDYVSLTKPRVVLMIVVVTAVAYHLGAGTASPTTPPAVPGTRTLAAGDGPAT